MATMRRTLGTVEKMAQSRINEEARESTVRDLRRQQQAEANLVSLERSEVKRNIRQMTKEQQEREFEAQMLRNLEEKQIAEQNRVQEEQLAMELARIKSEQIRDEKMRQQIRETSLEIRELEAKLRAAYTSRERATQLAEKEARRNEQLVQDAEYLETQRLKVKQMEHEQQCALEKNSIRKIKYQQDLEQQLADKELDKQKAYDEFLRDKFMIDAIVQKIYAEDQAAREKELAKVDATRKYITEFQEQRKVFKAQEAEKMEAENERIKRFAAEQKHRKETMAGEKAAREAAKAKVQDKLAQEMTQAEVERLEMENIRQELYMEEQEAIVREREATAIERRLREKLALQADHDMQMKVKEEAVAKQKAETEKFRQMMIAKFEEDDRLELMNAQKRRMKQQEHKRKVEEMLEQRRLRLEAEYTAAKEDRAREVAMEQFRQQVIEEERQKLLIEHADKLIGFLPKGVIQSKEDLNILGNAVQKYFTPKGGDNSFEQSPSSSITGMRPTLVGNKAYHANKNN